MRGIRAGAMLAAAASLTIGVVWAGAPARAETACPGLYVVAVPGTWETSDQNNGDVPRGMLALATDGLPDSVRTDFVNYAATAFPWEREVYGNSKVEAVDRARRLIVAMARRCAATRIALVGYSQGADAAGDLAALIGSGSGGVSPNRIAGVALLSDPQRAPGDLLVGPPVPGAGIGGPRPGGFGALAARTHTICAVGDLYCATPSNDFVARFAGLAVQASGLDPADLVRYEAETQTLISDLMAHGGLPTLEDQLSYRGFQQVAQQLQTFYGSAVHVNYPHYDVGGESATDWMHNWLASMA